jgi:hypothetical protein
MAYSYVSWCFVQSTQFRTYAVFELNAIQFRFTSVRSIHVDIESFHPISYSISKETRTSSTALVREGTIPTELSPLVGEVSANFYG